MNRLRANITVTTVIFFATFVVFCAFGVDTAFVALSRFKLQKATEVTALMSANLLNSGLEDYVDNDPRLEPLAGDFLSLSALNGAGLSSLESRRTAEGDFRVRIKTWMPVETYFLRFVGLNTVAVEASSAATSYTQEINNANYGQNVELATILTDKQGAEFSVESKYGYFVFAGLDTPSGIVWEDVSCKSQNATPTLRAVEGSTEEFGFLCENASFDLSKPCEDRETKMAKYIIVYKDSSEDACAVLPSGGQLNIKVLNNVKLVRSSDF